MKKRLRKKLHRYHLIDVTYAISVSSEWRKKLFQSKQFERHTIDRFHCDEIPNPLNSIIKNLNLKYYVYIVAQEEAIGWQDWDTTQTYFKFESAEFPCLKDFSANNPTVI
jgi:hypothetical protein